MIMKGRHSGRFLAAALAATPLAAEAADPAPVTLAPMVVTGKAPEQAPTAPVEGYVAARTATGTKTATPLAEVPQSVSVVGREEIGDRGATKVDEALRYTPGVFAQPFGADSDTNWIYIRGFDATQTGVYQDGLQNYAFAFGSFYVDSFTLERIEVLKGASSVLYGGSNPGGLVNYVFKRPTGERLRYLELGIDDAGTAFTGIDVGDRVYAHFAYRFAGRIQGGDGHSDEAEGFRGVAAPSLTWTPNDSNTVAFLANYTFIDETHNGGAFLPYVGTVVDAPFGRIDRDANFTEPDQDKYVKRQASIGYDPARPVLKDFDLVVPPGRTVALVGPSGVGKTTICSLLPRFYDVDAGAVRVDGVDVRDYTLASLRGQIGIVQQEVFLFGGTLRENIAYGRLDASEAEIREAARRARLEALIADLPQGLDTLVGERGVKLSGGQRQRVAIARMFLKNPPILILDEATSALDSRTEREIRRALSELARGRTTLIIAHRLATVRDADLILEVGPSGAVRRRDYAELIAGEAALG